MGGNSNILVPLLAKHIDVVIGPVPVRGQGFFDLADNTNSDKLRPNKVILAPFMSAITCNHQ